MVEKPIDVALWPRTRKGVALYALAAIGAVIIGVVPALWINRSRAAEAAPKPTIATPIVAEPTPSAPPAEPTPVAAEVEEQAAIEIEPETREPERRVVVKTTKRARPRAQRAKQAPKKSTPTCDIYLYPHGCPK